MLQEKTKSLKNHVFVLRDFLIEIFFPKHCIECGKEEEKWICDSCYSRIKLSNTETCAVCRRKKKGARICKSHKKNIDGVLVAGNYKDKTLHQAIKRLKYSFVQELKTPLGKYLATYLLHLIRNNEDNKKNPLDILDLTNTIFIPVPIHKKRLRWREFNQSRLLLDEILKHLSVAYDKENLQRIKFQRPQAKLNKEKRIKNIKNSFAWCSNHTINKNVILIDDVFTSGSTLEECARVLKQNGAREVWGLVIAKG